LNKKEGTEEILDDILSIRIAGLGLVNEIHGEKGIQFFPKRSSQKKNIKSSRFL
jgi:hypothetical protein